MLHRLIPIALVAAAAALAACGGGDDGVSHVPTLAGTPIPSAVIEPTATPVCEVVAPLPLPPNLPSDVPLPPDLLVTRVEAAPHLLIEGRTAPPAEAGPNPSSVLAGSLEAELREQGWDVTQNFRVEGNDYTFTAPDGRTGHFNAHRVAGCAANADLTLELFWITAS